MKIIQECDTKVRATRFTGGPDLQTAYATPKYFSKNFANHSITPRFFSVRFPALN